MVKTLRFSCDLVRNVSLQLIVEFVADPPDGQDILRGIGIRFDFFAQFSDKRHNVAVIQQVIIFPHGLVDLFFREYLSAVAG